MKNYYSTVDGIRLTFSDIEEDRDGFDIITFYFERENIEKKDRWSYFEREKQNGFEFAEGSLPENRIYKTSGFNEDELLWMQEYIRNNSFLIWEIAKERSVGYSA